MSNLNWVDFVILIIFFFSITAGFSRGFVKEFVSLLTLIAAFVVAVMFSNQLAEYLTNTAVIQSAINQASSSSGVSASQPASYVMVAISFAILLFGTMILGSLVGSLLNIAFQRGMIGIGDRLCGAAFGIVRGYLITLVVIFVVQLTPVATEDFWQQSRFVIAFQPSVQWVANLVSPSLSNLKDKVGGALQNVNTQLQNLTR